MRRIERICVFAGSSPGARADYAEAARALGQTLAGEGLALVYGGGSIGLMGVLADAVLQDGGSAIGVIPRALFDREVSHEGLTELRVVESMHERKAQMVELADAFIALPGGLGTLEELFEALTWAQLGYHEKPCGLLNVAGYYDHLLSMVESAVDQRFLPPEHRALLLVAEEPSELIGRLRTHRPPAVDKLLFAQEEL